MPSHPGYPETRTGRPVSELQKPLTICIIVWRTSRETFSSKKKLQKITESVLVVLEQVNINGVSIIGALVEAIFGVTPYGELNPQPVLLLTFQQCTW